MHDRRPSKLSGGSEGREWIVAGYSGEGIVHAWMSLKELTYMVSDKDVPARFAKVGRGKHRVARIYVGISEQSVLRLRASAHLRMCSVAM